MNQYILAGVGNHSLHGGTNLVVLIGINRIYKGRVRKWVFLIYDGEILPTRSIRVQIILRRTIIVQLVYTCSLDTAEETFLKLNIYAG